MPVAAGSDICRLTGANRKQSIAIQGLQTSAGGQQRWSLRGLLLSPESRCLLTFWLKRIPSCATDINIKISSIVHNTGWLNKEMPQRKCSPSKSQKINRCLFPRKQQFAYSCSQTNGRPRKRANPSVLGHVIIVLTYIEEKTE